MIKTKTEIFVKLKNYCQKHKEDRLYFTKSRAPFYELAGKYLPNDKNAIVADIGCSDCSFARFLELDEKYTNFYNLDKVDDIINSYPNARNYLAPERLPFDNNTVSYIHCSHLIEHLNIDDAYELVREMNRVLKKDGILVISAPLFNRLFFEHPFHVKIYSPLFFQLCLVDRKNIGYEGAEGDIISKKYKIEKVVYRYAQTSVERLWYSDYCIIEFFIKAYLRLLRFLKFRKFHRDAYTMVLKKMGE
ncbi:class I SAM-dependent methyltransferase [Candidatus Parcubacteria bacterium]|nr:class I SAM-dependent methyltransferase [Candidatus Parcubacteria bacterium]